MAAIRQVPSDRQQQSGVLEHGPTSLPHPRPGKCARALAPVWLAMLVLTSSRCDRRALSDGLPADFGCTTGACGEPSCSFCHGNLENPAPPKALNGSSDTSDLGVGAHQAHMQARTVGRPVACEECHPIPASWNQEKHPDLTTDMVFGDLASRLGTSPTWDRSEARCTNTYCHSATWEGAESLPGPVWTQVDGSQLACNSCHPAATQSASHSDHDFMQCAECHASVVDTSLGITNADLHVNGLAEVDMPTGGTWDKGAKTCAATGAACHGSEAIGW